MEWHAPKPVETAMRWARTPWNIGWQLGRRVLGSSVEWLDNTPEHYIEQAEVQEAEQAQINARLENLEARSMVNITGEVLLDQIRTGSVQPEQVANFTAAVDRLPPDVTLHQVWFNEAQIAALQRCLAVARPVV